MRTPKFTCLDLPLRWPFTPCARGVVKDREVILSVVEICVEFLKSDYPVDLTDWGEVAFVLSSTHTRGAGVPGMRSR